MRIILWDLKKYKIFLDVARYILVFILVFGILSLAAFDYVSSDRYLEAMIEKSEEKIIVIDAGHGGEDCGAIGVTGVYEKDLNLIIARELGALLTNEGYAVVYTRTEDKLLYLEHENIKGIRKISDLKNRCKVAAEYPEALFISIHMNSYSNSKYSGLQVYYSKNNAQSQILASTIQETVKASLQTDNERTIKKGENIYVLENVENCAVLIECGFLTNPDECKKLSEKEYQKQLSLAIVCGIIEYKEGK